MRCILHIGTEKTGTTSIQDLLFTERQVLQREHGIHVCVGERTSNLTWLAASFVRADRPTDLGRRPGLNDPDRRRAWIDERLRRLRVEIDDASSTCDTVIITTEHLHSKLVHQDEVDQVAAYLTPMFDQVSVMCYLRRQDEMATSLYSTALRAGLVRTEILPRIEADRPIPSYYDLDGLLGRWAEAFGAEAITPAVYGQPLVAGEDTVHDFCRRVGIDSSLIGADHRRNSSLNAEAQMVLWTFNQLFSDVDRWQVAPVRRRLVSFLELRHSGPGLRPARADARRFHDHFVAGNRRCAQRWFGAPELFDDDFGSYPDQMEAVDGDRVRSILADFFVSGTGVEPPTAMIGPVALIADAQLG